MRVAPLAFVLLACSAQKESGSTPLGTPDAASDGFSLEDGGLNVDAPVTETGGDDCAEENKQIYVVTKENELHRFAPATLTFTKIGTLSCPTSSTPFSMAVDRKGTAWVLFADGRLYEVSTKDASCKATSYAPNQNGFRTFGMSFVSDGGSKETLFVADYEAKGIARIDMTTLKLTFVGDYGTTAGAAELTGRGEQLFAFFQESVFPTKQPTRVAAVDKTTGKLGTVRNLSGVAIGSGWAFAHWGGSFWLFHAPTGQSQVTELDFDKGATSTVKSGLPFLIVGAGVSTCAPTTRPK